MRRRIFWERWRERWNLTQEISHATPILSGRIKKLGVPAVRGFQRESCGGGFFLMIRCVSSFFFSEGNNGRGKCVPSAGCSRREKGSEERKVREKSIQNRRRSKEDTKHLTHRTRRTCGNSLHERQCFHQVHSLLETKDAFIFVPFFAFASVVNNELQPQVDAEAYCSPPASLL